MLIEEVVQVTEPVTEPVSTQVTEPVTTEPVITEPKVEQPTFDWVKKYNINSEQDLEAIVGEKENLRKKVDELSQKEFTYKTEFAKVADELSAKGVKPETIAKFHGLKTEELSEKEAILRKLEIDFPTLSDTERQAYYTEEYGELENPDSLLTEGAKAHKKVQLQKAASEAKDYLKQFVYEALNPNTVSPEIAQKEEGRQNFWKETGFSTLAPKNELKLPGTMKLPGQNGVEEKAHDFVFQLTQADQQALNKEFGDTVLSPSFSGLFDNTEQGIKNANETYDRMFWGKFGKEIVNKQMEYAAQRESQIHEHYAKLMNNTSFKGHLQEGTQDLSVSPDQGMANFLKGQKSS